MLEFFNQERCYRWNIYYVYTRKKYLRNCLILTFEKKTAKWKLWAQWEDIIKVDISLFYILKM
jgi:hypothetical protein